MGKRRKSRESAMQYLYQTALTKNMGEESLTAFWEGLSVVPDVKDYATQILGHAISGQQRINELIEKYTLHWKINRIAAVDLAILRMAIAEMLFIPSTPPVVVIDEAVEIAKKYSTQESGAFVNGILDKIRREIVDKGN